MDFFDHQDRARRNSTKLVVLFVLAVVMIVAAVNAVAWGVMRAMYDPAVDPVERRDEWRRMQSHVREPVRRPAELESKPWQRPESYALVTAATLLVIVGGSAYKTAMLAGGGRAVAEMMGGRLVPPDAADPRERVLLNVVEEMSIASGVPVPAVYLMEDEPAVNAFAAGFSSRDAVVAVTRGCLDKLSRDELQGVVAHEFSHILHGDVRLNLRLIGLLHGILVIALLGYLVLRGAAWSRVGRSSRDKAGGVLLMLAVGVALVIIGYVGVFFGRLIQAAVSRQREFLADASAVQFTRNPGGLAGALKKIGALKHGRGSRINSAQALETAHLLFASGISAGLGGMLATHPPLEDRIRRIDPSFNGVFPAPEEVWPERGPTLLDRYGGRRPPRMEPQAFAALAGAAAGREFELRPGEVTWRVGEPTPRDVTWAAEFVSAMPPAVDSAAREPFGARAVVFSALLDADEAVAAHQLEELRRVTDPPSHELTRELATAVLALGPAARLPLVEMALPALRQLSRQQAVDFLRAMRALIEADRRVSLSEYALHKVVMRSLPALGRAGRAPAPRYLALKPVLPNAVALLSALASADGKDERSVEAHFASGMRRLGVDGTYRPMPEISAGVVNEALDRLASAAPGVKRRVVDALAHCVAADGVVQAGEAELLRAVTAALDCPLPPMLGGEVTARSTA